MPRIRLRILVDTQRLLVPIDADVLISDLIAEVARRSHSTIASITTLDGWKLEPTDRVGDAIDDGVELLAVTAGVSSPAPASTAVVQSPARKPNSVASRWATNTDSQAITAHGDAVKSLDVSATHVVTGSWDRLVCIWEQATKLRVAALEGHTHFVEGVSFVDAQTVASCSLDRTVRVWDIGGEQRSTLRHDAPVHAVCVTDGALVSADAGGTMRQWDVASSTCTTMLRSGQGALAAVVAVSTGGCIGGGPDAILSFWDPRQQQQQAPAWSASASASISSVASAGSVVVAGCANGVIQTFDLRGAPQPLHSLQPHDGAVSALALCGDGLVSGGRKDALIKLWTVDDMEPIGEPLQGHGSCVFAVHASPSQIISGGNDMTLRFWSFQ
eukprot:TRINITY_DN4980_c0_g1_i1.p1 TRINITY_DN4980_c0_g1~~TRINITY_DN4980_c0_g1_i1.p1  ORF type:complete len:386 (-),score=93.98 TRINITY_DN4980_c0_g1_i1:22-1179(-)